MRNIALAATYLKHFIVFKLFYISNTFYGFMALVIITLHAVQNTHKQKPEQQCQVCVPQLQVGHLKPCK